MKNHSRSRSTGPPAVYSYTGTIVSEVVSSGNGVSARQLSLFRLVRNVPLKRLPPDLVMALTTPPLKRPNSAETPDVVIVVSCSESSM